MSDPLPYIPAPHLVASSGLSSEELVSHFQGISLLYRDFQLPADLQIRRFQQLTSVYLYRSRAGV